MLIVMVLGTTQPSGTRRAELAAGIATIVVGLAVIAVVPELRHCVSLALHGQFAGFRSYIRSLGVGGLALLVGLMVGHAIVWYPSEIVTATAGYVYGFGPGLALVVAGWLLGALLSYALGRSVGRPLLQRLLGDRFARLTTTMERGGTLTAARWPAHTVRSLCAGRLRRRGDARQPVAVLVDHGDRLPPADHRGGVRRRPRPDVLDQRSSGLGRRRRPRRAVPQRTVVPSAPAGQRDTVRCGLRAGRSPGRRRCSSGSAGLAAGKGRDSRRPEPVAGRATAASRATSCPGGR